jgi:two-component system response regulator CpxR
MSTQEHRSSILIIDDDVELCSLLTQYLDDEGFDPAAVNDGDQGLDAVANTRPDVVILDVMMPKRDGFETLSELRKTSTVPVIMLTARGEDVDRIVGLELGADDYLSKPFNPRVLLARIRAILRRGPSGSLALTPPPETLRHADIELDASAHSVKVSGDTIELTAAEFSLLHTLMQQPGKVLSKAMLTQRALDRPIERFDRAIDMHVSNVRRKLGSVGSGHTRIKTVRGVGYVLSESD